MWEKPIHLIGQRVELHPLEQKHANELFIAGQYSEIWTYLPRKIHRLDEMEQLVQEALVGKDKGTEYSFVVMDREHKKIVGSTRFLNISLDNRNLEIGWTWYMPSVWRSMVNTECKYLLLQYCFEELDIIRVQFKADVRNDRSNRAIERIGAIREGRLRQDRILYDGYKRDSYIYSILDSEWPDIKERLSGYLSRT
jgi:RimJ/RimL family protein N-acetyltransferase